MDEDVTPWTELREFSGVGRIHDLERTGEGIDRLEGRFGTIVIHADRPLLHLQNPAD